MCYTIIEKSNQNMGELLMKKIIILFLCLITVNITGCSNFQEKNDDNNQNQTSQTEKITKPDFLDKDPYFFNTAFSKDEEGNLYFVYTENVYKLKKDGSIETLLSFKDMNISITRSKYFNGYLFMPVYLSIDSAYNTGILRMNLENKELKMFDTPNIHPFSMLIDDKKIYLDISDADWTTRYAAFDFNSDTGELSNYKLIEWYDYPIFIQNEYLKNKYPEDYSDVKNTRINYDNDIIYEYKSTGIEKTNLKTYERELYYLSDIYGIIDLLNNSYGTLDIIDDRIYLIGDAGVTSYDKNLGDMQFIIDNRNDQN